MTQFQGERSFTLPPAEIAAKLSDAAFLVSCLADAQVITAAADRAVWKIKPKLSFLAGGLDLSMDVTARDPGKSAAYRIVSKAIGATSTVTARLEFRDAPGGGTLVPWAGEIAEVAGLLKMVPKGLLQATAQKVIDDVWAAVGAKLTTR